MNQRIKVEGKLNNMDKRVVVVRAKSKITVNSEIEFSKRLVHYSQWRCISIWSIDVSVITIYVPGAIILGIVTRKPLVSLFSLSELNLHTINHLLISSLTVINIVVIDT